MGQCFHSLEGLCEILKGNSKLSENKVCSVHIRQTMIKSLYYRMKVSWWKQETRKEREVLIKVRGSIVVVMILLGMTCKH